jgi:hypothetical protein
MFLVIKGNIDDRSYIDITVEGLSPRLYLKDLAFLSDYLKNAQKIYI